MTITSTVILIIALLGSHSTIFMIAYFIAKRDKEMDRYISKKLLEVNEGIKERMDKAMKDRTTRV